MIELDADESRYLVHAQPGDAPRLKRIPGNRYNGAQRSWMFPRQAAVILALDRMFGADGWRHHADLEIEVAEARGRRYDPAQDAATVELDGAQLAIECSIADKELVKIVPGYRWSPQQRRWFVAAMPLALDVLGERFGDKLIVSADAETYIGLRRIDEEHAAQRLPASEDALPPADAYAASRLAPNLAPKPADAPAHRLQFQASRVPNLAGESLSAQILRLTEAVDALRGVIEAALPAIAATAPMSTTAPHVEPVPDLDATETSPDGSSHPDAWRELFAELDAEPQRTLEAAQRRIQTSDPGQDSELRAVAGIAAAAVGEFDIAIAQLRPALTREGALADAALATAARDSYLAAALALVTADCGPARPIATAEGFREMLLAELARDDGFDDATIGSAEARSRLEFLVNDPVLRRVSPVVSDYCRVAHLLGVSRSGAWMAVERVADVLRDTSLRDDGLAFATILFANVLVGEPCINEWIMSFPQPPRDSFEQDLQSLVTRAVPQLGAIERDLAAEAALACLRCLAEAPADCATLQQRRALIQFIPASSPVRRYAEFLAAFPLAALGQRAAVRDFPGYAEVLARKSLEETAPHLLEVFVQGSGGPGSIARVIAEQVIVPSVAARGVNDPKGQLLDFLDIFAESPRVDNLLNQLGALVEDGEFPGADLFEREQRKLLYRRALEESVRMGHDHDMREAFNRLVRELHDEGARAELRTLASKYQGGPKPLRIASLVLLLEALLEDKAPFEETLTVLFAAHAAQTPGDEDNVVAELEGLAEVYPEIDAPLRELLRQRGIEPTTVVNHPDITGCRLVVVGGHQWLKRQALPVLTDRWKLKVEWLDPHAAKNGGQALGLAAGASDLIVINTSCIGHAASGRVSAEAKAAGTNVRNQPSHGVGSLLTFVRSAFEELKSAADTAPGRASRVKERRRALR